jgi:hypothetical protein
MLAPIVKIDLAAEDNQHALRSKADAELATVACPKPRTFGDGDLRQLLTGDGCG